MLPLLPHPPARPAPPADLSLPRPPTWRDAEGVAAQPAELLHYQPRPEGIDVGRLRQSDAQACSQMNKKSPA